MKKHINKAEQIPVQAIPHIVAHGLPKGKVLRNVSAYRHGDGHAFIYDPKESKLYWSFLTEGTIDPTTPIQLGGLPEEEQEAFVRLGIISRSQLNQAKLDYKERHDARCKEIRHEEAVRILMEVGGYSLSAASKLLRVKKPKKA